MTPLVTSESTTTAKQSEFKSDLNFETFWPWLPMCPNFKVQFLVKKWHCSQNMTNMIIDLGSFAPDNQGPDLINLRQLCREIAGGLFLASEATAASKVISDLISMCILLIWYGPFWQPPNSVRGRICFQIWSQSPQLPTYPCEYCLHGMDPFDRLGGHYSLQPALLDLTSDLKSVALIT